MSFPEGYVSPSWARIDDQFDHDARTCERIVSVPDDPDYRFDNGLTKETETLRLAHISRQLASMATSLEEKGSASMETINRQPINEEFDTILKKKDDRPGPPFYDKTLNFLQARYNKTNSNIGNLTNKKFKIEDQIAVEVDELETLRQLLIDEYRARQPFNEDGEVVPPPLGLTEEEIAQ